MTTYLSKSSGSIWISETSPGLSEENAKVGNFWLDTITKFLWMCTDETVGAQVWTLIIGV